ncbi:hypothetical protein CLAFUW4_13729 [Fulvia fulva]|uniref:Uncharacterized protein n=1 Tax=Passalora fulva TaxID=5499 RepID=A0A9Q8PLM1_PASFU|nr:uncharacterized protein CLAFUR5_13577 [Fulvia fulva]KAK4610446.1 hypothetical protein CLAFUR4_13732 [Fulvia fulva]KAK4611235.1 hypothetical protein CLAFUR0_13736 [Fulvia fulva]UJO24652.1 hypothetical protein CLAFUR5_13577 [Fulvia fulva]WPV21784.1 hypothetical protein CLAFUW4_13729 [Fulvia fulva]WPV36844.1 hypothetical protein CLAFUW7_13737 [Fulvia fulva]
MSSIISHDPISYRDRSTWDRCRDYWKLPYPYLDGVVGYADRSGCTYTLEHFREFARHYFNRKYLRLFPYEDCSIEDLKRFCEDRKLDIAYPIQETVMATEYEPVTATMVVTPKLIKRFELYRADFIAQLNTDDDNRTFHGFAKLPPELRVHIYTWLFLSYGEETGGLELPVQPPITRVSRLLRKESLPVFYQTCTFQLRLEHYDTPYIHGEFCRVPQKAIDYFTSLQPHYLGWIRRLHCAVEEVDWAAGNPRQEPCAELKESVLAVQRVMDELMNRSGECRLQVQDLNVMVLACREPSLAQKDYGMQLMLLEQQNRKRLLMARLEMDSSAQATVRPGRRRRRRREG